MPLVPMTPNLFRTATDPFAKQDAERRRIEQYAAKFNAETVCYEPPDPREPTDANLAAVLDRCVRPARPAEYPAIRAAVLRQRAEIIPRT